jgi:ketosteroid isomerase-like protein
MPLGRFDRERWKRSWATLFETYELIHNHRTIVGVLVSEQEDGGFAVVDVDTLWRHRSSGEPMHWQGRACKVYTKVGDHWLFLYQTGLLNY